MANWGDISEHLSTSKAKVFEWKTFAGKCPDFIGKDGLTVYVNEVHNKLKLVVGKDKKLVFMADDGKEIPSPQRALAHFKIKRGSNQKATDLVFVDKGMSLQMVFDGAQTIKKMGDLKLAKDYATPALACLAQARSSRWAYRNWVGTLRTTIARHVGNSPQETPLVSATTSISTAAWHSLFGMKPVFAINIGLMTDDIDTAVKADPAWKEAFDNAESPRLVWNLGDAIVTELHLNPGVSATNFGRASQEVLIAGSIAPKYCERVLWRRRVRAAYFSSFRTEVRDRFPSAADFPFDDLVVEEEYTGGDTRPVRVSWQGRQYILKRGLGKMNSGDKLAGAGMRQALEFFVSVCYSLLGVPVPACALYHIRVEGRLASDEATKLPHMLQNDWIFLSEYVGEDTNNDRKFESQATRKMLGQHMAADLLLHNMDIVTSGNILMVPFDNETQFVRIDFEKCLFNWHVFAASATPAADLQRIVAADCARFMKPEYLRMYDLNSKRILSERLNTLAQRPWSPETGIGHATEKPLGLFHSLVAFFDRFDVVLPIWSMLMDYVRLRENALREYLTAE